MARVDKAQDVRRFVVGDPTDARPAVILWKMATTAEWDVYERGLFEEINPRKGRVVVTPDAAYRSAKRMVEFAMGRIVGIDAFEVSDGNGGTVDLAWPMDKARVIELLAENVGECERYVRTVREAHQGMEEREGN